MSLCRFFIPEPRIAVLLYATPRFAFLSVQIIRLVLSGRRVDHGIIVRLFGKKMVPGISFR